MIRAAEQPVGKSSISGKTEKLNPGFEVTQNPERSRDTGQL